MFVSCGTAQNDGEEYSEGDYLCQVTVPPLGGSSDGYYLTRFEEEELSDRTKAARFLERNTWGASEYGMEMNDFICTFSHAVFC